MKLRLIFVMVVALCFAAMTGANAQISGFPFLSQLIPDSLEQEFVNQLQAMTLDTTSADSLTLDGVDTLNQALNAGFHADTIAMENIPTFESLEASEQDSLDLLFTNILAYQAESVEAGNAALPDSITVDSLPQADFIVVNADSFPGLADSIITTASIPTAKVVFNFFDNSQNTEFGVFGGGGKNKTAHYGGLLDETVIDLGIDGRVNLGIGGLFIFVKGDISMVVGDQPTPTENRLQEERRVMYRSGNGGNNPPETAKFRFDPDAGDFVLSNARMTIRKYFSWGGFIGAGSNLSTLWPKFYHPEELAAIQRGADYEKSGKRSAFTPILETGIQRDNFSITVHYAQGKVNMTSPDPYRFESWGSSFSYQLNDRVGVQANVVYQLSGPEKQVWTQQATVGVRYAISGANFFKK